MDPFRLSIALGPLAVYCLIIGLMNISRRPWLTTGARDTAALAIGVSGLLIVGPMELFLPEHAAVRFGGFVWLLLIGLYALGVSFLILTSRPRLVVYNITGEELRPILAELVLKLDGESRWAGDSLLIPQLGVQLHIDCFPTMRCITLVANGDRQNFVGWRRFELALAERLRDVSISFNPRGVVFVTAAILLLATCLFHSLSDGNALAQGFEDMLRL